MQHIIIGDGVAGHTAAERLREEHPDADIHVFTREEVPFYDRIGLKDYIRGGRDEEELVFNDAEWYAENDIDLHLGTEVVDIDRDAKNIRTADGASYDYDKLLLAVGSRPRTLPLEEGVETAHHLWTIGEHGRPLRQHLMDADTAVAIGGGLLGFDFIGSFNKVADATYLIREDRWWHSALTMEGAEIMHDAMREAGVDLRLNEEAESMEQDGEQVHIVTNRDEYTTDVVGIAVGNVRNLALAEDAGLDTSDGILCDEFLQTSDPDIYAAGDAAEYYDVVLGRHNLSGSWITAEAHGEAAAKNMAGAEEALRTVDTYTVRHFGINVASLGDPTDTDGKAVITAVDRDEQKYRKLVLEDGRIVGAAILGEMRWMHPLQQLMEQEVAVDTYREELEDADFNPAELA